MAGVMDVMVAFEKFQLEVLDNQWVNDILECEFTSVVDDLPGEYYEIFPTLNLTDMIIVIEQVTEMINLWLENVNTDTTQDGNISEISSPNWGLLNEINHNALLALLYFYISKGQREVHNIQAVHTCIKATNLYFVLLQIPKASVYKIFQCSLYEKCLETFFLCKHLNNLLGKGNEKKSRFRKQNEEDSDEELTGECVLTISQEKNIVKQLNFLLSTFKQFINTFSFKGQTESLKMTLKILAHLTRTEKSKSVEEFFNDSDQNSLAPLSRNAYLSLKDLCSSRHGKVSEIVRLILFNLFPNFTLIGGTSLPEMSTFSNKELNNIRNIAVSFLVKYILTLGEVSHYGITILIQQLCSNMIDRADYRTKATDMIILILSKLSIDLYYELVKWIIRQAVRDGANYRVIGVDLLSKLIYLKHGTTERSAMSDNVTMNTDQTSNSSESDLTLQRQDSGVNSSQEPIVSFAQPPNHTPLDYRRTMLAVIIDRIRDEATGVRTRALCVLSELIANNTSPTVRKLIDEIFVTPYLHYDNIDECNKKENNFLPWKVFLSLLDKPKEKEDKMIPGGKHIASKVFTRCLDERVGVRKAALQVVANIFKLNNKWMTPTYLELFGRHSRDPGLSVRKEIVGSLSDLVLCFPTHSELILMWVKEVLPQIIDREPRVQEYVMQLVQQLLIDNITSYNDMRHNKHLLPWKLLTNIGECKMKSFLVSACGMLYRANVFRQQLVNNCRTHVGTENNAQAWLLLSAVTEYYNVEQPNFVFDYYVANCQNEQDRATSLLALRVLHNSWHKLKRQGQESVRDYMLESLSTFSVHNTHISLSIDITASVMVSLADSELAGKKQVSDVAADMIQVCEGLLEQWLDPSNVEISADEKFMRTVGLLGFLAPICPERVKESTFNLLFQFVFSTMGSGEGYMGKLKQGMKSIAIITLGKMALCNAAHARTLVPALSHALTKFRNPVELNNVVVAIADIGERYASLIEPLMPALCLRLKSEPRSVANTTLLLLVELLQEGFLKPTGRLVYHLLTFVYEDDPVTSNLVKYYFINMLIPKEQKKLTTRFMLALFHYNCYFDNPNYPRLEMTEEEETQFNISGASGHDKRMSIYKFLLANIPATSRVNCVHYLIDEVLRDVAEGNMPLSDNAVEQLVYDTLNILLTREAQVTSDELTCNKKNDDNENDEDGGGGGGGGGAAYEDRVAVFQNLGRYFYNAVEKKNIVEHVVPICCKLKKRLTTERPNLVPLLRKYVRFILQTLKVDLIEVFKDDEQFGKEMIHELEVGVDTTQEGEDEGNESDSEEEAVPRRRRRLDEDAVESCLATQLAEVGRRNSNRVRESRDNQVVVVVQRLSEAQIQEAAGGQTAESGAEWEQEQQKKQPQHREESLIEEYDPDVHDPMLKRKRVEYGRSSSSDSMCSDGVRIVQVEAVVETQPPVSEEEESMPPPAISVVKRKKSINNPPDTPAGGGKISYASSTPATSDTAASFWSSEFSPIQNEADDK